MRMLLLIATLGFVPHESVVEDHVDVVEVNHFYDETGRLVFDQLIFWEWCDDAGDLRVVAWRFVKTPHQLPIRDFSSGGFYCIWHDRNVLRNVRSHAYRETWTQLDPEVRDRKFLPQSRRRGLLFEKHRRLIRP